jgi:hypothetical protein
MNVGIHNPSTVDMKTARIAVPHGNFDVMIGDQALEAKVMCSEDYLQTQQGGKSVESCFMDVELPTPAWSVSAFTLKYNQDSDLKVKTETLSNNDMLKLDNLTLQWLEKNVSDSSLSFLFSDGTLDQQELTFNLKYWSSYLRQDNWDNSGKTESGMYIFTPQIGQYESNFYSKFDHATKSGEYQWDFYFQYATTGNVDDERRAIVHVRLTDQGTIKFDLDLNSLPSVYNLDGYEVVAEFSVANFNNNQTFYTDSNGLEMQKRILNSRPTWDFANTNLKDSNENITANYYPVQSALSMLDGSKVFTVMNDRSQGASALKEGTIEFM